MKLLNQDEILQVQGAEGGKYWYSDAVETVIDLGLAGAFVRVASRVNFADTTKMQVLRLAGEGLAVGAAVGLVAVGIDQLNEKFDLY